MENFTIMTDSASDLPLELKTKYNVDIVPLLISFDKQNYLQENVDISIDDFYKKLRSENVFPKTSLAAIDTYMTYFKKYLDKGQDILFFTLCADLSGSYQAAKSAVDILSEEYTKNKILIVDSRSNSAGYGLVVLEGCKMREAGYSIENTFARLEVIKLDTFFAFTADDLKYLQKGGRLGKASALFGTLLNIKPIIYLKEGLLEPYSKVRGRKKCIAELISFFAESIGINADKYEIGICHADCLEDALEIQKILKEKYNLEVSYPLTTIGASVGAHTGPDAIGISYIRKYDS